MQRFRQLLISIACVVAVLLFRDSAKDALLLVLRAPFSLTKSFVNIVVTLPRLPGLAGELAQVRSQLIRSQIEISQLREQLRQASRAATLIDTAGSASGMVARVIGRSILPMQHTILLDKGSGDGIVLDTVVADANGIVGRIVELHATTSLAILLTDPDSRIAAMVERSRESGLLVGNARGQCELIYLGAQADISADDRIVTAGLGGIFPKGLTLGTVTQVTRNEVSGYAVATVQPSVQMGRLEEVLCLPPETP